MKKQNLIFFVFSFVLFLFSGCETLGMKGTPLYSGEYPVRKGADEDRVNLWPLAYYRDPALSLLWPIAVFTDEQTAIRPIVTMNRQDGPGHPYDLYSFFLHALDMDLQDDRYSVFFFLANADLKRHEYNLLLHLIHFDFEDHDYCVFPFFWENRPTYHSFSIFPLFHDKTCYDKDGTVVSWSDSLFPLWDFRRNERRRLDYFFPYYHSENLQTDESLTSFLLGGRCQKNGKTTSHWLFPLYYDDVAGNDFLSLFYTRVTDEETGKNFWSIPLLFTSGSEDPATETSDLNLLLFLAHWHREADRLNNYEWIIPFYYLNRKSRFFVTPFWGGTLDDTGSADFWALPPLLSWHTTDKESGLSSTYLLGGLLNWQTGEGNGAFNFFPLFSYSEKDDHFISPLYGKWHPDESTTTRYWTPLAGTSVSEDESSSWFFPLYSHTHGKDFSRNRFLLLAGNETRLNSEQSSNHLFPLYRYEKKRDVDALRDEMDACAPSTNDQIYAKTSLSLLLGLGSFESSVSRKPEYVRITGTNELGNILFDSSYFSRSNFTARATDFRSNDTSTFFPLFSTHDKREVEILNENGLTLRDVAQGNSSFLLFLHDTKYEKSKNHDYFRRRILWHLYHYERLNGDESLDVLPFITYDRKKNGFRKTSVLWRLFRYEKDPETDSRKLDLLFIPILR